MTQVQSDAVKKVWSKVPKKKRSETMRALAKKRMRMLTPEQRKKIGKALTNARKAKLKQ